MGCGAIPVERIVWLRVYGDGSELECVSSEMIESISLSNVFWCRS